VRQNIIGRDAALDRLSEPTLKNCGPEFPGESGSSTVIPPGGSLFFTARSARPLNHEEIDSAKADFGIAIMGIVEYQDLSGHSYRSSFCIDRLSGGGFASCPKYNYIKQIN
jgi:hypothetical protein